MITITAKRDGFRRCGVAHSKEPTEYKDDVFTPEQLKILQGEPMLVVQIAEDAAGPERPLSKDVITAIKAAQTVDDLNKALPDGEDRKTVLEAYKKRGEELTEPTEPEKE